MADCIALVLAGGSGARFSPEKPKQYVDLAGMPILRRSIDALRRHPQVTAVRIVLRAQDRAECDRIMGGTPMLNPVIGGVERQDSARLGLESLVTLNPTHVLIHDAARPFVPTDVIDRVLTALTAYPAVVPAIPLTDTLKKASSAGSTVLATIERPGLWRAQTPQGFRFADILAAHRAAAGQKLTDDAAVAEQAGLAVGLVMGSEDNLKITTQSDIERANLVLTARAGETRVGTGFDVHKFCLGDRVMLCGVAVPHAQALEGHSDADVGLHALTDAILGGLCAGDIGSHFPPSDPQWRGAASEIFLRHAAGLVNARGGRIVHVDVTLICEAPKIGPHRARMCTRIAEILGIAPERVSIKATTTEGLGFTGRREGIAAQAVATIMLPPGS